MMLLSIDPADPRPLHVQIAARLRQAIVSGDLQPGERLPSGRDLAQATGVALETVQRAYRELADEGVVVARVGRGTSVAPDIDHSRLSLADDVDNLVTKAARLGVDEATVVQMLRRRWC